MIYIGIDVAKRQTRLFYHKLRRRSLFNAFTIPNNADGFHDLFQRFFSLTNDFLT